MAQITFIAHGGDRQEIEIPDGWSVMQGAVREGVEGIEAECGGSCACATCHCFIDPAFLDRLPPPSDAENDLLDATAVERAPNSRLSCQITVTPALDGMIIHLPERQS